MLKFIQNYYEREYKQCHEAVHNHWDKTDHTINCTLQRMLGVAFFVQTIGVEYESIEPLYMEYKGYIDKLREVE